MRRGEELERMFGVTNEQSDGLQFVGFEAAPQEVAAMDERAAELGMSRSDYLRSLVRKDLAAS